MPGSGTAGTLDPRVAAYLWRFFPHQELVLDVGCGKGVFLSDRAVGIDYDLASLSEAPGRVVRADLQVPLPFRDATFDGILAKDIVEHVQEPAQLMAELRRVSKPRTRLVLTTPRAIPRAVWADYTHVRGFTKKALLWMLSETRLASLVHRAIGRSPPGRQIGHH